MEQKRIALRVLQRTNMLLNGGCSHLPQPDYEGQPPSDAAALSCKDCPDDECTGHCMSCAYRSL